MKRDNSNVLPSIGSKVNRGWRAIEMMRESMSEREWSGAERSIMG